MGLSVRYMRFEGRVTEDGSSTRDKVDTFVPLAFARMGVRLFRYNDFDLDIFFSGYLPLMGTRDEGTLLFQQNGERGRYTPSLQVGLGVGF